MKRLRFACAVALLTAYHLTGSEFALRLFGKVVGER